MKYVSDSNLSRFLTKLKGIFAKKSETQAAIDAKMTNPMTAANDLVIGGTNGTPTRLAKPSNFSVFRYNGSSLGYSKLSVDYINHTSGAGNKCLYADGDDSSNVWAYGKPGSDIGLGYTTTAPSAANTDGIKIAVVSSEPSDKYAGWLTIIT